ncbi:tRNA pseudouridine(13) synthase TruD [Nannocystaceae bacterium ST9]
MHGDLREIMLWPPRAADGAGDIGGRIRGRAEDFEVVELPAYSADGREGHLLLTLTKRGLDSEAALAELARALRVDRGELGLAGLKDRHALTTQWISVPARAEPRLAALGGRLDTRSGSLALGAAMAHGHKLRRGHLRGNLFRIVVRDLDLEFAQAHARASACLERLARVGLRNYYGEQRFGHGGRNLAAGLSLITGRGPRARKADLKVGAAQAGLFNLLLAERIDRGLLDRVLLGDILHKRATEDRGGGMFECSEPEVDQARLDAGELELTGPIYGSKLRWPSPGSPAAELEHASLAALGIAVGKLERLGRAAPGTRRALVVRPEQAIVEPEPAPAEAGLGEGLVLRFALPAGSYATVLLRELGVPGSLTSSD